LTLSPPQEFGLLFGPRRFDDFNGHAVMLDDKLKVIFKRVLGSFGV
jgi:hypothetical protein